MQVKWSVCQGNIWCGFRALNLDYDLANTYGVYIIWMEGSIREIIYIGEGNIGERIRSHRNDLRFSNIRAGSYVTWAIVSGNLGKAIEAYLSARLNPRLGITESHTWPIIVNLPKWQPSLFYKTN